MNPARKVLAAAIALTVVACTDTPIAVETDLEPQFAKGEVVHSAGGSGHFTYTFFGQPDTRRTFSFTAREHADGTFSGEFNLVVGAPLGPGNPAITRWSQGKVICLSVAGNEAWIGGVIINSSLDWPTGTEVGWKVVDNGQGRSSDPDIISVTSLGAQGGGATCTDQRPDDRFTLFEVERGNIQVR